MFTAAMRSHAASSAIAARWMTASTPAQAAVIASRSVTEAVTRSSSGAASGGGVSTGARSTGTGSRGAVSSRRRVRPGRARRGRRMLPVLPAPPGLPGGVAAAPARGGAGEDAEPAAGVAHPAPCVGELEAGQLREGLEEVLGQPGERGRVRVARGADAAAVVVDRVVAAPQDPVVGGQPVVVELVASVGQALPVPPSAARPLGRRQWLRYPTRVVHP